MVISNLKGGLGNYLFQIASGYSLAIDNNVDFRVDLTRIRQVHSHWDTYTSNIFRKITTESSLPITGVYRYESLTYKAVPYQPNVLIDGYYQSDKYFINNKDIILDLFKIDDETLGYLTDKYPDIVNSENTCSLHVRRGDFLTIPFYNKISMDYYNQAIDEIGRDKHFVVFSDDIAWCKENFKDLNVTFIEGNKDYQDLYLMSLCKNNITANSTFSWWGSYLNMNPNKKVVTPNIWFVSTHSNNDITPSDWIKK